MRVRRAPGRGMVVGVKAGATPGDCPTLAKSKDQLRVRGDCEATKGEDDDVAVVVAAAAVLLLAEAMESLG